MQPLPGSAFLFTHRNTTLWIPFLITRRALPQDLQPHYSTWLLIEVAGHIFTAITIFLNIYIALKVNAFNLNMQVLNIYGILVMGATNMGTRILLILIEFEFINLHDMPNLVVPLIIVKLTAWLGIYNCVIYITIERYAALKYSSDYETNRRVFISLFIIAGNSIVACTVACLLVFNIVNGAVYMLAIFCISNLSCVAFSRIALRNKKENKKVCNFHGKYSVSRRWQVKDNIRMIKDIRLLIYGCAAQISFYLPIFFIPPLLLENDPKWVSVLELNKAIFQLVCSYGFGIAYLFCTLCVSRHFEYIKSIVWRRTDWPRISPAPSKYQTAEDHFDSLRAWWDPESSEKTSREQ